MSAVRRLAYENRSTLVVIPTYNEVDNLEPIIVRLFAATPSVHVLVVDDGSPDGTGRFADVLAEHDERVCVLHRTEKAGLGAAYIAGFRWALAGGYDVIVEMDADGSHAPEQLPRLLAAIDDADLVLGSRWIRGGRVQNWPLRRKVLSRGGNAYTRIALGIGLHDATGGYRAYRRGVLETLDLALIGSQGYCFQVELAWRAAQAGFRITEVPITFAERERGESKMSGDIIKEALVSVTKWGVARRRAQLAGAGRRRRRTRDAS